MNRYIQVYNVNIEIIKDVTILPTDQIKIVFSEEYEKAIIGGIRFLDDCGRIFSITSIKDSYKPEIDESIEIFNLDGVKLGKGKLLKILVQE
ncbi:hypothetical protein [Tenacibaculum halocynthiae]|uniref:hypothetical protein n=1 Tax=Tenacibaculum halocynthiae TaxID=1254437 RepID=UPI003D6566E2